MDSLATLTFIVTSSHHVRACLTLCLSRPIARLDTALELSAVPNTADLADSVDTFLPFSMVTLLRALSLSVQCTCGHGGSDGSKDEGPLEVAHANNSDLGLAGDSEVSLLDDGGVKFNDLVDAQVLQYNRTSYIRTHIKQENKLTFSSLELNGPVGPNPKLGPPNQPRPCLPRPHRSRGPAG